MANYGFCLLLMILFANEVETRKKHQFRTGGLLKHIRPLNPCVTKKGEDGLCVHKKVCPGEFEKNRRKCPSLTGRRLVCCTSFAYKLPKDEPTECGKRPSVNSLQKREMKAQPILGGHESRRLSWPWLTAIYNGKTFICGGALISKNCILTAAHCFDEDDDEVGFFVRLGEHSLVSDEIGEYPEEYEADKIIIHPHYKTGSSDFDLAIIRLNEPAREAPICLPHVRHRYKNLVNLNATVAGWGTMIKDGLFSELSTILQEISIPIVDTNYCHSQYKGVDDFATNFKNGIDGKFLCAGVPSGEKDTCQGDSGGPLMMELEPDRWSLIGVVCIGLSCGEAGYPGVYTKVMKFQSWIEKTCNIS